MKHLFSIIAIAIYGGLIAAIVFIFKPQDLSDLKNGMASHKTQIAPLSSNLKSIQNANGMMKIKESELNLILKNNLLLKQEGYLAEFVKVEQVMVRMHPGFLECIIVRSAFGFPITQSVFYTLNVQDSGKTNDIKVLVEGGMYHEKIQQLKQGGRFGSLIVPPAVAMLNAQDMKKIALAMTQEITQAITNLNGIQLEKGQIILDYSTK